MIQIVFVIIAALGLAAALGTVLARNLVHAALFLMAFFFTVACLFVLLEAEFLAALQVLVYIGAVAVLLMFGIMLTRNIQGDDPLSTTSGWQMPGLIAGFGLFLLLGFGISFQSGGISWSDATVRPAIRPEAGRPESPRAAAVNNMARAVGDELLSRYVIAFEVAGLLLTAALVGAIALAHREEPEPGASAGEKRTAGQSAAPPGGNGPAVAAPTSPAAEAGAVAAPVAH